MVEYVDLDHYKFSEIPSVVQNVVDATWVSNEIITLKESHKDILTGRQWLTSDIVNAAQKLLAAQFNLDVGLQDTEHDTLCTFITPTRNFIQTLHDGDGQHWVTILAILDKSTVDVYDSLYISASPSVKRQVAALLSTPKESIELRFMDVQKQSGTNDCGLFAVTFATVLCFGKSPSGLVFDQSLVRTHLCDCLENSKMAMFPVVKARRNHNKVKSIKRVKVYCLCRMPSLPKLPMISCSRCHELYHTDLCVDVDQKYFEKGRKWFCSQCI